MSVDQSLTASVVSGVYKNISLESRHLGSLLFLTRKKSTDFNFPKERPESRYSIKIVYHGLVSVLYKIFGSSSLYNVYFNIFELSLKWNG